MNLFVCLKMVPDTVEELEVAADQKTLDPEFLRFKLSDPDEHALEQALLLKEKYGGTVTVVAMLLAAHIPVALAVTGKNFLRLTALYLTAAVPFFLTGLVFSIVFAREAMSSPSALKESADRRQMSPSSTSDPRRGTPNAIAPNPTSVTTSRIRKKSLERRNESRYSDRDIGVAEHRRVRDHTVCLGVGVERVIAAQP